MLRIFIKWKFLQMKKLILSLIIAASALSAAPKIRSVACAETPHFYQCSVVFTEPFDKDIIDVMRKDGSSVRYQVFSPKDTKIFSFSENFPVSVSSVKFHNQVYKNIKISHNLPTPAWRNNKIKSKEKK